MCRISEFSRLRVWLPQFPDQCRSPARQVGREMVEEGSFLSSVSVGYRPSFSGLGSVSRSFGSLVFSSEQEVGVPS